MSDGLFLLLVGSISIAAPVQGGIGLFHIMVASALTLYGFDKNEFGLIFATLQHESQAIFIIILGFISSIFLYKYLKIK